MDALSLYAGSLTGGAAKDKPADPAPAPAAGVDGLSAYEQSLKAAAPEQAGSAPGNVQAFVAQYKPLADRVSKSLGVAPEALLGQWGLETGWGKSVIPGTNNLGNIKDFSGKGAKATDNMTGSVDAYRTYGTADEFGDDFAALLGRRYKSAVGSGKDSQRYFQALKTNGYAEDPDYVSKGVAAAKLAAGAMGGAAGGADAGSYFVGAAAQKPLERSNLEAAKDVALGAGAGVVQGVEMVASAFGADNAVARGANDIAQSLIDKQSPARKQQREQRAAAIQEAETSGSTWGEIVANVGAFADAPVESTLNAIGTSVPTLLTALIPGLGQANVARLVVQGAMGAAQGAGAVKGSIYEAVERELSKPGPGALSKDDAKKAAAAAQAYDSQNGGDIAIGALLGWAAGSAGIERSLSRILSKEGGEAAASGIAKRAAMGALAEAPMEGAQGGQERLAANRALQKEGVDVPTWQGVAGSAAGEAVASVVPGGVFGALTPSRPALPPELQPVAAKAAEPNSPLSKAAMAANTPEVIAQRQAAQAAQAAQDAPPAAPANAGTAARLAELEQINSGAEDGAGRFFTPEEQAEYKQLTEARDATPGAKPKDVDTIGERAKEIAAAVREAGALEALRSPDSPVKASDLVKDLAMAQSPSTPAAAREQALGRVEFALQWAGVDLAARPAPAAAPAPQVDPVIAAMSNPAVSDVDKATLRTAYNAALNTRLPQATRDQALAQAREIAGRYATPAAAPAAGAQTPAVLGAIEGSPGSMVVEADRMEGGAFELEAEGYPDEAQQLRDQADSLREQAATARAGETGVELEAEDGRGLASPEAQQPVDLPTTKSTPAGEGPAYQRRRRASLQQLAAAGFTTVARTDGNFAMVNPRTGQTFALEGAADSQLARKAIADHITAAAAETNTNPTDGQKSAGNYKKARIDFEGLSIAIENPVGSERKGKDDNGEAWATPMELAHYGYVVGSESADGDGSDIYLLNTPRLGAQAYVIDQYNEDGSFDETKTVLGASSEAEALRVYDAGFSDGSGPSRRGAVTAMSVSDFKAWANSPAGKKAAGPAPEQAPGAVVDGSMKVKISADESVDIDLVKDLPEVESVARGGRATRIGKKQGAILQAVAQAFGKDIKFFTGAESGRVGDGFILPSDNRTIYLNVTSSMSPVVVFGHELMHQLKRDNPEAHAAVEAVVARRMNREAVAAAYGSIGYKDGQIMEELVSDLGGDLMADPEFWSDVMDEVHANNDSSAARKIIAKLAEFITRAVDAMSRNLRSYAGTGAGSALVDDMTEIRTAFQKALAGYMQDQGISKMGMQADVLRAGQEVKRSASRQVEETENFKRWFGDSKVVDAAGNPMVVYHGTLRDFDKFAPESHFGTAAAANKRLRMMNAAEDGAVMPVYLSIQNPKRVGDKAIHGKKSEWNWAVDTAKLEGYDGIVYSNTVEGGESWIAFSPNQVKSATGNNGDFSVTDANITRSAPRTGIHYSKQPREVLDGRKHGTGMRGLEAERLERAEDPRIQQRVYAYLNGRAPESNVGGYAHEIDIGNLYDGNTDPLKLWGPRDFNKVESAIMDAGFDGYYRGDMAVIMGDASHAVKARPLNGSLADQILKKGLMSKEIREIDVDAIPGAKMRAGILEVPASNVAMANAELARIGSQARFSLRRDDPMEVSTRAPWSKNPSEDAIANLLTVGLDSSRAGEKAYEKNIALVREYPNYRPTRTANTTERQGERFIEMAKDNLLWLYDGVPQEIRERSHLWYDGAQKITDSWMKEFGIDKAQAAGAMAVLSPQKDWFMNVDLARRVISIMDTQADTRWGAEMTTTAERIFGKPQYQEDVQAITGKRLSDIESPALKAMWVRTYDEAFNSREHDLLSPEGDVMGPVMTLKDVPAKVAWGDLNSIAKAVSILEDGSLENISARLGSEHKVRNFYNNILVPNSTNGHVTIDTHAVAAALLRPLSGSSLEVLHNFGGAGAASSAPNGSSGTYGLYAEAYRRAAAERGTLARQMQSITWEAVRGLFTPGFKSQQKNVDTTVAIWENYRKGRLSLENARQEILDAAGGIAPPSWFRPSAGSPAQEGRGDAGVVPGVQLPGRRALPAAGGTGGPAAGAAALDVRRSAARDGGGQRLAAEEPLPGAPRVAGATGPDPRLVAVAEAYAQRVGIDYRRQAEYVQVDEQRAARIAAAYDAMEHAPQDPKVKAAFQDLIRQTRLQYDALADAGYEFYFADPANDPYAGNPWSAMRDVRANQRMAVFPTAAGFGSSETFDPAENPMLEDTGLVWGYGTQDGPGMRVLANDLFRAVHDAFGHGLEGAGFRAQGEENAWQAHARLFTGPALGAITSETRGQNSWLNYNAVSGEANRTAKVEDTIFADQKTGLMPEWTWTEGRAADMPGDRLGDVPGQYNQRIDALKELIACLGK